MNANHKAWIIRILLALLAFLTFSSVKASDNGFLIDMFNRQIGNTSNDGLTDKDEHLSALPDTDRLSPDAIDQSVGIFESYKAYVAGSWDQAVGVGDFDHDGLNDVAISESGALRIFRQLKVGGFAPPVIYQAGSRAEALAVGDLNSDGLTDIVTANFSSNTIGVFLQNTDGTLAPHVTYTTSTGPDAIAIADLNNDGRDDVVVSHWNAAKIGVFYQKIDGTLNGMVNYASPQAGYDDIDTGDVNNDGLIDVVKMNGQGTSSLLSVYLQTPTNSLAAPVSYSIPGISFRGGVAVGDVTGDGRSDVVVSYGGNSPSAKMAVFSQTISGTLTLSATYSAYDIPEPVELADVNGDGLLDVLTLHGGWTHLGVFLQNTMGSLDAYQLYSIPYASHYGRQGLDIGDINNDKLLDVAIADYNNGLVILDHVYDLPNFQIRVAPPHIYAPPGKEITSTITILPTNFFTNTVSLAVEDAPPAFSSSFSTNPAPINTSVTLMGKLDPDTPVGVYPISIKGVSGDLTRYNQFTIVVLQSITALNVTSDAPTNIGGPTSFTANVLTGSFPSYTWDFGDGTTGFGASVKHLYGALGIYNVAVTARNEVSSETVTTTVLVQDVPVSGLIASNDSPTIFGKSTRFNASIVTGTHVQYLWDFGDGTSGVGNRPIHQYLTRGQYTASVRAVNSTNFLAAETIVTVTDDPITGLSSYNSGPTITGETAVFTATVGTGTNITYTWDFGDGQTGSGAVANHAYKAAKKYLVILTATNYRGVATSSTEVSIYDLPIAGFVAANSSPHAFGEMTYFTASVESGTAVQYDWDFGDGTHATGAEMTHRYSQPGIYIVKVEASNTVSTVIRYTIVLVEKPNLSNYLYLPMMVGP